MTDLATAGELADCARVAHSLQGAAGSVGAKYLGIAAADLQNACAGGDLTKARRIIADIASQLDEFRAVVAKITQGAEAHAQR